MNTFTTIIAPSQPAGQDASRIPLARHLVLCLIWAVAAIYCLAAMPPAQAAPTCKGKPYDCACGLPYNPPHGYCREQDSCTCYSGWAGTECQTMIYCGSTTCTSCNGPFGMCDTGGGPTGKCYCGEGLTGSCCEAFVNGVLVPAGLDFGGVSVASAGPTQSVTFRNPLPTLPMTLGTVTLGGANSSDFFITGGSCADGASIAGSSNCIVAVSFTPTAPGARSATLFVTSTLTLTSGVSTTTSPVSTLATTLSGTGVIAASSVVVDPLTPTTLYTGMDGAGVYYSLNSGSTWTAASTQPTSNRVRAVVIKPGDSTKLFAATYGGGVFQSGDSGVNWDVACATQPTNLNLLSLVMDAAGKLYAGSEAGVFVSSDGCANWAAMNSGLPN